MYNRWFQTCGGEKERQNDYDVKGCDLLVSRLKGIFKIPFSEVCIYFSGMINQAFFISLLRLA
jgi:hypothetical protein